VNSVSPLDASNSAFGNSSSADSGSINLAAVALGHLAGGTNQHVGKNGWRACPQRASTSAGGLRSAGGERPAEPMVRGPASPSTPAFCPTKCRCASRPKSVKR